MNTAEDLKSLQAEAILRLNCSGIGRSSSLNDGDARPLTEYKVIIVNPVSIVHLFGEDPSLIRQIDMAQAEGLTSCKVTDEQIIDRIGLQIELRSPELFQFLAEGGLLIYYLCRPFVVTSESRSMDNYAWLCGLAPDQSGESTMSEQMVRHMSTVAHGRNIDKTLATNSSKFSQYFDQVGLEWNTIIRTDFLTSGYTALALAGPKKCIAGELIAGDKDGRVIFLPAPYSPDFDRVLIECINAWYADKYGIAEAVQAITQVEIAVENNNTEAPGVIAQKERGEQEESTVESIVAEQEAARAARQAAEEEVARVIKQSADQEAVRAAKQAAEEELARAAMQAAEQIADQAAARIARQAAAPVSELVNQGSAVNRAQATNNVQAEKPLLERDHSLIPNNGRQENSANNDARRTLSKKRSLNNQKYLDDGNGAKQNLANQKYGSDETNFKPEDASAKDLDNNINFTSVQIAPEVNEEGFIPDWCKNYWLPGMDNLIKEVQVIRAQIKDLETKLVSNESTISSLEGVKSTLLTGQPGNLLASCKVVLDTLGWRTEFTGKNPNELVLIENNHSMAVVRVAVSQGQSERTELARLTETLINFWDSHGNEPKGILIACTFSETPVLQRKEPDFPEVMIEFAKRKNICLIATTQLISMYLEAKLGKIQTENIRQAILSTSGSLAGFTL